MREWSNLRLVHEDYINNLLPKPMIQYLLHQRYKVILWLRNKSGIVLFKNNDASNIIKCTLSEDGRELSYFCSNNKLYRYDTHTGINKIISFDSKIDDIEYITDQNISVISGKKIYFIDDTKPKTINIQGEVQLYLKNNSLLIIIDNAQYFMKIYSINNMKLLKTIEFESDIYHISNSADERKNSMLQILTMKYIYSTLEHGISRRTFLRRQYKICFSCT